MTCLAYLIRDRKCDRTFVVMQAKGWTYELFLADSSICTNRSWSE